MPNLENLLQGVDIASMPIWLGFVVAFLGGLLSFLSPCVLPLVPAYVSFISGVSVEELRSGKTKEAFWRITFAALLFTLGLSVVFVIAGGIAGALTNFVAQYMGVIEKVAGVLIFLFGVYMLGFFRIGFVEQEHKFHVRRSVNLWGAFFVGLAFAFGWTPCIGPIIAGILMIAATQGALKGMVLLAFYSLGLAVPFIISALAINAFFSFLQRIRKAFRVIEITAGVLLMIAGVLVFFGVLSQTAAMLGG